MLVQANSQSNPGLDLLSGWLASNQNPQLMRQAELQYEPTI
jgi:hypothetical protein